MGNDLEDDEIKLNNDHPYYVKISKLEKETSNISPKTNELNGYKGYFLGKAIVAGGQLLEGGIQAICNSINKSKDIEIEKLKIENEKLIQKEKEKTKLKQELKLQLEKKEEEFYETQIVKYSYNENLFDKENIKNIIDEKKLLKDLDIIKTNNNFMKEIEDKINGVIVLSKYKLKKCKRLNIYIMGITGVGKTCLKNSICDKLYSQEKFGGRGTTVRQRYICECHDYLSFTDNIGFELGGIFNLINLVEDTQNYIMEKIKSNDEAIHCLWYCITGTRLQEEEYKVICNLRKIYKEKNIPIIIIYTQAIELQKIEDMKKFINQNLKSENNEEIGEKPENIQFIPLLAKQTSITVGNNTISIPPYNLSRLIESTFNSFEYSVDLVNKKCLIELVKEKIKNVYETKLQSCLEIIGNNLINEKNFNNMIESIYEAISLNKFKTQFFELKDTKDIILSYINEKYKFFKEEKERKILNDIMAIERDFCLKNSSEEINIGSFMKSEKELKAIIDKKIDDKNYEEFKSFYFNKISRIFFNYFAQELVNKLLDLFEDEIESEKMKTEIYNSIKICNDQISEGIRKLINELKIKESQK